MRRGTLEGIVLKSKNHGEGDKIIHIFSKKRGVVKFVAKGVRKITSRRLGSLDLLNQIVFSFHESSTFPYLTEVKLLNSFSSLKEKLNRVSYGYTVLELLDKFLLYEEENENVYEFTVSILSILNKNLSEEKRNQALIYFKLKLLSMLGFDPVLDFCQQCLRDFDSSWKKIGFSAAQGGIVCESCGNESREISIGVLNLFKDIKRFSLKGYMQISYYQGLLSAADEILTYYTEYNLDSPIRSERIFNV